MIFFPKKQIAIFLYHRIFPQRDPMWDPVDPVLFERTLRYIQSKFHVAPLEEILFNPPTKVNKPLAAITFDDGYKDFIDYAMPLLNKHKIPASMYIPTDCIDNDLPTWTYIIDYLFTKTKKTEWANFDFFYLPKAYHHPIWHGKTERIEYGRKLKPFLKNIAATKRDEIIKSMLTNFNDVTPPKDMMMSWDEIKQISTAGIDIGAHSITHPTLATIDDEEIIKNELKGSYDRIYEQTGIKSWAFSYPIGSYNDRVKELTIEAGYKAGLSVNQRLYNPAKDDLFEIPRIQLYNESWLKTTMRINGMIEFLQKKGLK